MKKSKKKHYEKHAMRRAFERYDLRLTQEDIQIILRMCRNGEGYKYERQTHDRSRVWLEYKNVKLSVVYARRTKALVSVLPLEDFSGNIITPQ